MTKDLRNGSSGDPLQQQKRVSYIVIHFLKRVNDLKTIMKNRETVCENFISLTAKSPSLSFKSLEKTECHATTRRTF